MIEKLRPPTPAEEKAVENIKIDVDNQRLTQARTKRSLAKPYVAEQVDQAFLKHGITLDLIAGKVKEQLEATVWEQEPLLTPAIDEDGNAIMEEVTVDGVVKQRPVLKVTYEILENGRKSAITRAVQKPDYKTRQFGIDFWKDVLIATTKDQPKNDATDTINAVTELAKVLASNPEAVENLKRSAGIEDAEFEVLS